MVTKVMTTSFLRFGDATSNGPHRGTRSGHCNFRLGLFFNPQQNINTARLRLFMQLIVVERLRQIHQVYS